MLTRDQIAQSIDHTLLKTTAKREDIMALCKEAVDLGLFCVCVPPCYTALAAEHTAGSQVRVATVVGFPNGYSTPEVKGFEARQAVALGAHEVDMVANLGAIKAREREYLRNEISLVITESQKAAAELGLGLVLIKVIIETAALCDDDKVFACEVARDAGANFVKTSTGFGGGGATEHDVRLMRRVVGEALGVKASGGVRNLDQLEKMLASGATRIGTSSGAAILREYDARTAL